VGAFHWITSSARDSAVRRLGREKLTVSEIAERLARPEAEIMDVLTMLGLPLPGEMEEERPRPTEDERAVWHEKTPKRWQDRMT